MTDTKNSRGNPGEDAFDRLLREALHNTRVSPSWIQSVLSLPGPGDLIDGKYEINERLGSGGMGAVFSAVNIVTHKRVALKWMLPSRSIKKEMESRIVREAKAAGRIDHPNVLDVYDIGQHEGIYYLVMELLHGEPLSARDYLGVYTPKDAITLMMPVMRGVAAAHAEGVIHRDLKPANIFLCRGPDGSQREPKVLDFGISKLSAPDDQTETHETTEGAVLGTPSYMAPEQLRSGVTVDHRADIYALGVILYELLSGRLPYSPMSAQKLFVEIATGKPQSLAKYRSDLPVELIAVVMTALAREPDDRYPDVRSFALALEPFGEGAIFDQRGSLLTVKPRRNALLGELIPKAFWIAGALVACLVIAIGIWYLSKKQLPPTAASNTETAKTIPSSRAASQTQPESRPIPQEVPDKGQERTSEGHTKAISEPTESSPDRIKANRDILSKKAVSRPTSQHNPGFREITVRNKLRASVVVTLKCGGASIEIEVAAKNQRSTQVPRMNCRVICKGVGEPLCPIVFRDSAKTLVIR